MAGPHPADPFTHPEPDSSYLESVDRPIDDMTIAYSPTLDLFRIDSRVRETVDDAVAALSDAGATVDDIEIDFDRDPEEIRSAWKTFFQVLIADVIRQLDDTHDIDLLEDHGSEIDPLIGSIVEAGRDHSVMAYKRADSVRTDVYGEIAAVFDTYDILVTPTPAVPPFEADRLGPSEVDGTEIDPFIDWILSWIFNMTDHPAASIPAGFVDGPSPSACNSSAIDSPRGTSSQPAARSNANSPGTTRIRGETDFEDRSLERRPAARTGSLPLLRVSPSPCRFDVLETTTVSTEESTLLCCFSTALHRLSTAHPVWPEP